MKTKKVKVSFEMNLSENSDLNFLKEVVKEQMWKIGHSVDVEVE